MESVVVFAPLLFRDTIARVNCDVLTWKLIKNNTKSAALNRQQMLRRCRYRLLLKNLNVNVMNVEFVHPNFLAIEKCQGK